MGKEGDLFSFWFSYMVLELPLPKAGPTSLEHLLTQVTEALGLGLAMLSDSHRPIPSKAELPHNLERRILSQRPRGIWPGLAVFQPSLLMLDHTLLPSHFNAVPHASSKGQEFFNT